MINHINPIRNSEQPSIENIFDLGGYVNHIRDNTFKDTILKIREFDKGQKYEYRKLKFSSLPFIYYYGDLGLEVITDETRDLAMNNIHMDIVHDTNRFKGKTWLFVKEYNGLIVLDIDNVDDIDVIDKIKVIPWVSVVHLSASGKGFRVIIQTDNYNINKFELYYENICDDFIKLTKLKCDKRARHSTLCFFTSWDPEIFHNENAVPYKLALD